MGRRRRSRRPADGAALFFAIAVAGAIVLTRILGVVDRHVGATIALVAGLVGLAAVTTILRIRHIRAKRAVERLRLIEALRHHEMNPTEFEHVLAALCERDGCRGVRVVGGAGDLGADVIALAPDNRRVVLQAKRYRADRAVGSADLQKFGGTCFTIHKADVAALVTTAGGFTTAAGGYAAKMNIRLVDAKALAAWASQTGPAPWQ